VLAESRGRAGFDVVIVVDVPPRLQAERLVRLRGLPPSRPRPGCRPAGREERLAVADIVIDNSGSLDDLDRRVAEVWPISNAGPPPDPFGLTPGMSDPR